MIEIFGLTIGISTEGLFFIALVIGGALGGAIGGLSKSQRR